MPRPIAFSAKQKREQLQDKRAVKRGELDPSEVRYARNPAGNYRTGANHRPDPAEVDASATRLHSRFIAMTPEFLERTRDLAHTSLLGRPLENEVAIFPAEWMERDERRLGCPARPAFIAGQTKDEVERNEVESYDQWLRETRAITEGWVGSQGIKEEEDDESQVDAPGTSATPTLRSPTWFETNLEVWRQLWRVTESSQILLLLADARCPALHLPTSLRSYFQSLRPHKEVILVLTKSDLVEPAALAGWKQWVRTWWAQGYTSEEGAGRAVQVITVQSFDDDGDTNIARRRPNLPRTSRLQLIDALQVAHGRLRSRSAPLDSKDPSTAARPMESDVDWAELSDSLSPSLDLQIVARKADPLTVGLIGQPNVGKSSLLNAVLGETRVRAGRSAGKTKHFQTMFWGSKKEVRFVDCPGLVCPSLVGMELQALCGVLPIPRIPSLPACILTAARLLPLEQIFAIPYPPSPIEKDEYEHKRTWRGVRKSPSPELLDDAPIAEQWTAWKIIEGRALDRGYLTAKTGRPDGNRAATGMMLALAEGRVRWCFYPPESVVERQGRGMWSGGPAPAEPAKHSSGSEGETSRWQRRSKRSSSSEETVIGDGESDVDEDLRVWARVGAIRFSALQLEEDTASEGGSSDSAGESFSG